MCKGAQLRLHLLKKTLLVLWFGVGNGGEEAAGTVPSWDVEVVLPLGSAHGSYTAVGTW